MTTTHSPTTTTTAGQATAAPEPEAKNRHRRRWTWLAAAAALAIGLSATAAYVTTDTSGEALTIHGSLTLRDPDAGFADMPECRGSGGYDDIHQGAQVTVTDPDGTVLAIGSLGPGRITGLGLGDSCRFQFSIGDVPAGHGLYGIQVTHRGTVVYEESRLDSVLDGPALVLG
jgi:hypothetical protein